MLCRSKKPAFSMSIARGALESIFDECDKYDTDETGGRLLGTYRQHNARYPAEHAPVQFEAEHTAED